MSAINERYKGTYVYGDMKFPNAIPRIVSDELFDKVQEILGEKKIQRQDLQVLHLPQCA